MIPQKEIAVLRPLVDVEPHTSNTKFRWGVCESESFNKKTEAFKIYLIVAPPFFCQSDWIYTLIVELDVVFVLLKCRVMRIAAEVSRLKSVRNQLVISIIVKNKNRFHQIHGSHQEFIWFWSSNRIEFWILSKSILNYSSTVVVLVSEIYDSRSESLTAFLYLTMAVLVDKIHFGRYFMSSSEKIDKVKLTSISYWKSKWRYLHLKLRSVYAWLS